MKIRKKTTCTLLRHFAINATALVITIGAALSASAQSTNYPATILSNNPVAYYQLQETNGPTAYDSTSNGFNATYDFVGNTPELGFPGIDSNSIAFLGEISNNGSNGYGSIDIPYNVLLAPVATDGVHGAPFSIECWVEAYTDNSITGDYGSIIGMFGEYGGAPYGNASGWLLGQTPGPGSQWLFNIRNVGFLQDATAVTPLQWTYLVGTWDGSIARFYVDAKLVSSSPTSSGYLPDNGSDGAIGAVPNAGLFPPYEPWLGGVDQVAFYTNVLTEGQISNDYAVGLASFSTRPAAPVILSQPTDETNYSGTDVTFSVVAIGSAPLYFQWNQQGVGPVPGATNSVYKFVSQYATDNGAVFSVSISNAAGNLVSDTATLTVETNMVVEGPPFSIQRNVGSYAAFRIAASGAEPITYQWSVSTNGGTSFSSLPGQTADTLWLTNVQLSADGNEYAVVASNPFTSYSNSAILNVVPRTENVPLEGYAAIVAADKPVAYWQLNEQTNATVAVDAVGSFDGAYDNTQGPIVYGITGGVPNDTNTAVDLQDPQTATSGLGGIVTVPYALELNPYGPWSMEAWIRPDSVDGTFRVPISSMENTNAGNSDTGWLIYEYGSINPSYWTLVLYTGGTGSAFQSDFSANPFDHPLAGVWSHLVVTDDGVNIVFYVNGTVGSTTTVAASGYMPQGVNGDPNLNNGGMDEIIGQRSDFAFFGGNAGTEDVAFYNYALSPAQVTAHFSNKAPLYFSYVNGQLVLTWPAGTLVGTADLSKGFSPVLGAMSPYTVPIGGTQFFYAVKVP